MRDVTRRDALFLGSAEAFGLFGLTGQRRHVRECRDRAEKEDQHIDFHSRSSLLTANNPCEATGVPRVRIQTVMG